MTVKVVKCYTTLNPWLNSRTQVPDRSVFFDYLMKRLQQNDERYVTSQALFDSFKKAVINNSMIVPQDGVIADTGDEGGDFIFIKRK